MSSLPQSGVELVAENAAAFIGAMNKSTDAVDGFEKATAAGAQGVTKSGSIMTGVLQGVGQAAFDMAAQGAQAFGQFVTDSVGKAGDFEAGMNSFQVAAGGAMDAAGLKTAEFRDLFLELGQKLPVSTKEVQDAATTLVKGGLDPLILKMGGLESSIQFAAAAGLDLNSAAELSVKQLGTFVSVTATAEEQTAFLAKSQDLLVKAAGASTLDVGALGDAMLSAGGQAKAAGVEYQDFVTTMGLISPSFGSASEAGTSFKNFLVRLQPATDGAAAAMQQLNLLTEDGRSKFYDANGQFIGMEKAAGLLKEGLTGLSDAQRVQALQTIFGNDAMGTATALADGGAEAYDAFAKKMEEASGVQATAAGKQKGFNVALDNFKGSVEALQITLGDKLLPILTDVFNTTLAPAINTVTKFASAFDTSTAAVTAANPVLQKVTDFLTDVGNVVKMLSDKYLRQLTDTWEKDLVPALEVAQAFFVDDLLPILDDLTFTVLPILDSAIQVLASYWTNMLVPAIKVVWAFLDTSVIPIIKTLAGWLHDTLPPIIATLADFFSNKLFPAMKPVFDFLEFGLIPTIKVLADVIGSIIGGAIQGWINIFGKLAEAGKSVSDFFAGAFKWALDGIGGAFEGVGRAIDGTIGWVFRLGDAIRGIPSLPPALTPGSPTPFEMGLRGISGALKVTVPEMGRLTEAMSGMNRVTPDASPQSISGGSVTNNISNSRSVTMPVYTNNSPQALQSSYAIVQAIASGDI
jgi:TP901 family phage tail tape measure protein